jgi:ribonuclease HI
MKVSTPHYMLFSHSAERQGAGHWRFVLEAVDGSQRLVADDVEPDLQGDRLELLTVVRGLEALNQPSRVTLVTQSPYVREGIRYGLPQWRRNGWRWEWFGHMVPVKNRDLWRRIDRALQYHQLECRTLRFDPAHDPDSARPVSGVGAVVSEQNSDSTGQGSERPVAQESVDRLKCTRAVLRRVLDNLGRLWASLATGAKAG